MKNFVQKGNALTLTADRTLAAGDAMLVGKIYGVAYDDLAAAATGEVLTEGVCDLTALSTDTAAIGDVPYWDNTNHRLTTTATGNTRVGVAVAAKAAAATTARIKLDDAVA